MKTTLPIIRTVNADGSFTLQKRLDHDPLLFGNEWAHLSDEECWRAWGRMRDFGWRDRPMNAVALTIWNHNKSETDSERMFVHRTRGAESGTGWWIRGFMRLVEEEIGMRVYELIDPSSGKLWKDIVR